MAKVLNITSSDSYQELACPGTRRLTLQVSNNQILIGFGHGFPTPIYDQPDEPYLPTIGTLSRVCDSIRVKNAVAGQPADVKIATQP